MAYSAKGAIKEIYDTQEIGNFKKRVFVISVTDGQYTNPMALQFTKDKVSVLDNFKIGQSVEAHFNIRSNESKGSWYVNLECWKLI